MSTGNLISEFGLEGYEERAVSEETGAEDKAMVAHWECRECGHKGLNYWPFTKYLGRVSGNSRFSYRPFAVCPVCGYAEEF